VINIGVIYCAQELNRNEVPEASSQIRPIRVRDRDIGEPLFQVLCVLFLTPVLLCTQEESVLGRLLGRAGYLCVYVLCDHTRVVADESSGSVCSTTATRLWWWVW
jgi:hypothetical protein